MLYFTIECANCGTDFVVPSNRGALGRKYCSQTCYRAVPKPRSEAATLKLVCTYCGSAYTRKRTQLPKNASKYCSRQCMHADPKRRARYSAMYRQIADRACDRCGKIYKPSQRSSNMKYCSQACARIGKRKHARQDITECQICGKALTIRQISNMSKYCSNICTGAANRQWHKVPENKAFMRDHGARCTMRSQKSATKIEVAIQHGLDSSGIPYVYQFPIANSRGILFVCDFGFPDARLVVECDGDYWHSLPKMQKRDRHKNAYLKAAGYTVLRFTETQIKQDVNACIQVILSVLKKAA